MFWVLFTVLCVIIVILIIILCLLLLDTSAKISPQKRAVCTGEAGERYVARLLSRLPEDRYIILNNMMLPTLEGTTQIDHVVVSIHGIFVIETKNYNGWIYGNEYSSKWTQNIYGKKSSFQNPLHQNYKHVQAIKSLLPAKANLPIISIVVFTRRSELKNKTKSHVIHTRDLIRTIAAYKKVVCTPKQMQLIADGIANRNIDSARNRKRHVAAIQKRIAEDSQKTSAELTES